MKKNKMETNATERHFCPPPTGEMVRELRKQEQQLKLLGKDKKTFRLCLEQWPQLEVQVKNLVTNNRSMGISASTKTSAQREKTTAHGNLQEENVTERRNS